MTSAIEYHEQMDGVLWCTLNAGNGANAINPQVVAGLQEVVDYVDQHADIVAVVVSAGGGRHFCAGGDLRYLAGLSTSEAVAFSETVFTLCDAIEHSPAVWCAMLKGAVLGGGAELALAFDIRFAHPDVRFVFSQLKMGLTSGWGGFGRLSQLVGRTKALNLVLNAAELSAHDLQSAGIVEMLSTVDEKAAFDGWRSSWCTKDARTIRASIKVLKNPNERVIEREVFRSLWGSATHRRALNAFLNKA